MGLFGHIMKFLLIAIVCVLVVLILAGAAMFLFPGFKLFGYHYISSGLNQVGYEYLKGSQAKAQAEWNNADVIRIDTDGYDVNFQTADNDLGLTSGDIMITIEGTYRGFVKGSVEKPTYTSSNSTFDVSSSNPYNSYYIDETRPDKKIYFIQMKEPEKGFLIRNQTCVNFLLTNDAFENKDVEIITKGGAVKFLTKSKISCNNLKISSDSGAVFIDNVSINKHFEEGLQKVGNLEITKSKKGSVTINTDMEANVSVFVNGGTDSINIKNIQSISGENSKLSIKSHNGSVNVENVYGDFSCECNGAKLSVGNITGSTRVNVKETACHFGTIGQTAQVDTLSIETTGKASLEFEKVFSKIDVLKNASAKIIVKESLGDVNYKADGGKGTLDLQNVHASKVNIVSTNGKVKICCNKNEKVDIISTATSGIIEFSGVEKGKVEINKENEQSSCSIIGSFEKISGRHVIKTTSGKIDVKAHQDNDFSIFWIAKSANMNIFGNLKTTIFSSEEYCKQKGLSEFVRTTAFGEPCDEKSNSLDLHAVSGNVIVSAL